MEQFSAIIIDDEKDAREALSGLVELYCPELEILGEASSIPMAKSLILAKRPTLIFLDISIGETLGFDLLKQLENIHFQIIFTTAHSEYALRAFRVNALDYLLKPIEPVQLVAAVEKAKNNQLSSTLSQQLDKINQSLYKQGSRQLTINSAEGIYIIDSDEICYVRGEGNYSTFYLKDKNTVIASKNLGYFEKELGPPAFFRCHQSFIVNVSQIKKINSKEGILELKDGARISFSAKKKEDLLRLLNNEYGPGV